MILFLIPFPARASATDWNLACSMLQQTLDSVANQSDRRFRVMLCCHDIPEVSYKGQAEEMIVHPVSFPPGGYGRKIIDKNWKLCSGHFAARLSGQTFDYIFPIDADDFVHKQVVGHILESPGIDCWQAKQGYQLDHSSSRLFSTNKIHEICGTSFCISSGAAVLDNYTGDPFFSSIFCEVGHKDIATYVSARKLFLREIAFPSIIYRVNNNASMLGSEARAFTVPNLKRFCKFTVFGSRLTPSLQADFGMHTHAEVNGLKIADAIRLFSEPPR